MDGGSLGIPGLDDVEWITDGGHSTVYRAVQADLDRPVAVKVITATGPRVAARFDRERLAMGRLSQQPGILPVYDSGFTSTGRPYLLLAWIESGSLQDRLDSAGALDVGEAVEIATKIAKALERAHALGVVHADIKPANVLVDPLSGPLVADFGIARLADLAHTTSTTSPFTPYYAAPEILAGEQPSRSTDVYGLAATLFALIEGAPPFDRTDGDLVALSDSILLDTPSPLSVDAAPQLNDALTRALAKDPADRPSMADFAEVLESCSAAFPQGPGRHHVLSSRSLLVGAVVVVALGLGSIAILARDDPGTLPTAAAATRTVPNLSSVPPRESVAPPESAPTPLTVSDPSTAERARPVPATTPTGVTVSSVTAAPPLADATVEAIRMSGELQTPALLDGVLWVTRDGEEGGSVARVDTRTGAVIDTIALGSHPSGAAVGADSVWVHVVGDGRLMGLDRGGVVIADVELGPGRDPSDATGGFADDSIMRESLDAPVVAADGSVWVARVQDRSFVRYEPETERVTRIGPFLSVAQPVAHNDDVWLQYRALCVYPDVEYPDPDSVFTEFAIPFYEKCERFGQFDPSTGEIGTTGGWADLFQVGAEQGSGQRAAIWASSAQEVGRHESVRWVGTDQAGRTHAIDISGDRLYANFEQHRELARIHDNSIRSDGELLWLQARLEQDGSVVNSTASLGCAVTDCPPQPGVTVLHPDAPPPYESSTGAPFYGCGEMGYMNQVNAVVATPNRVWITVPNSRDVCVFDRSASGTTEPATVLDAPTTSRAVWSHVDDLVWIPRSDGYLSLVGVADAEGTDRCAPCIPEVVADLELSPGLRSPLVTEDGTVWQPAIGVLYRILPAAAVR